MAIPTANAINAYTQMANMGQKTAQSEQASAGRPDFGALVEQAINGFVDSGRETEKVTSEAIAGKADMVQVVTAVAETELALDALVSVRDRMVSAYEEIIRMPI